MSENDPYASIPIPEGWHRVTAGPVRYGDRYLDVEKVNEGQFPWQLIRSSWVSTTPYGEDVSQTDVLLIRQDKSAIVPTPAPPTELDSRESNLPPTDDADGYRSIAQCLTRDEADAVLMTLKKFDTYHREFRMMCDGRIYGVQVREAFGRFVSEEVRRDLFNVAMGIANCYALVTAGVLKKHARG